MDKTRYILITGGTKGIGLAIAKQFAKQGDQCLLTYSWGSVEESDILAEFERENLKAPRLFQANVASEADTQSLFSQLAQTVPHIDVFISNVAFSKIVTSMEDYLLKSLLQSIRYSTWPIIAYTKAIHNTFKQYPRYIIGLSSQGSDRLLGHYDFVAVTKVLMETLAKYLNYHLISEKVSINILRTRDIPTSSTRATFGEEHAAFKAKYDFPQAKVSLDEVAKMTLMMTSGLMDAVRGQIICADKGFYFMDGTDSLYMRRQELNLPTEDP